MSQISLFLLNLQSIYAWVNNLSPAKFKGLIGSALTEYEKRLWGTSRRKEIEGYFNLGQEKTVAMTLLKGKDSSTLNDTLFDKIITAMKTDIRQNPDMQNVPGNKLILQFNPMEDKLLYLAHLKEYSVAISQKQDAAVLAPPPSC